MTTRVAARCLSLLLLAGGAWTFASAAGDESGERLYVEKCGQCHGAEGRGAKGPRLVPFIWSYEQTLEQLRHPQCDMPPMPESEISDAEVAAIVGYLKTIK